MRLSSTCPNLPLPIKIKVVEESVETDELDNGEKHPLQDIWEDDLSYYRFEDDIDDADMSYYIVHDDLYAGVDL